jgi:hypothetical protein
MARKRRVRGRAPRFALKSLFDCPRHAWATMGFERALAGLVGVFRASAGPRFGFALARRGEIDAGATGLGQSDGDRLLGRPGAVLAAANLADLLMHELAGLRAPRLSGMGILRNAQVGKRPMLLRA